VLGRPILGPEPFYVRRNCSVRSLRELGELAGGMQYPAVTIAIRRFAVRLKTDAHVAKKTRNLKKGK
jgi:hypothetical protein